MAMHEREIRRQLLLHPIRFAVPILVGYRPGTAGDVEVRTATGTLIEFEERKRLVTNHHVIQAIDLFIDADQNRSDDVVVQIADNVVQIDEIVLQQVPRTDLAVLDVTGMDFRRPEDASGRFVQAQFLKPNTWPGPDAGEGDSVMFGGYPEAFRRHGSGEVTYTPFSLAGMRVTSATYESFRVLFDRDEWRDEFGGGDDALRCRELSGLSGSPVFVDKINDNGLTTFDLVGFVEAYDRQNDVMVMTSASNIRSDGSLKP